MKKYYSKEHLERSHVADHAGRPMTLTLGGLKERVDAYVAAGVSLDTVIAIEHIGDEFLETVGNGWTIIDYLWETYDFNYPGTDNEGAECYSRSIPVFQMLKSVDDAGDTILVITPHY